MTDHLPEATAMRDAGPKLDELARIYGDVSEHVSGLGPAELSRPSRCAGWTVGDVLYHLLLDARRALVTYASPGSAEPDVDAVTYWRGWSPADEGAAAHAEHVRRVAAAYSEGMLGREWRDTAAAAVRAATACRYPTVTTQGHTLTLADFTSTLIFEATVHHLDMTDVPPDLMAMRETRRVLDGLLGSTVDWDDRTYVMKATGREPLTGADRAVLGERAGAFPLTG